MTAQAYNRFGYSAPTDPEFVIPVSVWRLDTLTPPVIGNQAAEIQLTGIIANAAGFYPVTTVSVHFGNRVLTCRPSPFGECIVRVAHPPIGHAAIYVTYTGYGRSYRSPTHIVRFASVDSSSTAVAPGALVTLMCTAGWPTRPSTRRLERR